MRIYLGGAIFGRTDGECHDWRTTARGLLAGHELVDPMARDYRGREDESFTEIVEGDKRDIESCDLLLMNCRQPSFGTAMEVLFGWQLGRPVYVIIFASHPVSPWIRYHATRIFSSLSDAAAAIQGVR